MNGVHDMGGMDGFGPVEIEANEPPFHHPWEGRVMAMARAIGANSGLGIDTNRFAREALPPAVYLTVSYYQKWYLALRNLMIERGMIGEDEVAAGHSLRQSPPLKRGTFSMQDVKRVETRANFGRDPQAPATFKLGDRVRTKNINPVTHTRLPRYVRGHVGVVERINGCHVFPDSAATGQGENPQWLYTVVFEGPELWGANSDPTLKVSIEAFEPYLEPA